MLIQRLELFGYKRLLLSNIEHIVITPESKIQLILGTNGSGKSSILFEMSPTPASHFDFTKNGYKYIDILNNNSLYELKNIFSASGNKFHFIKDGEELNPGGTVTVYKELVKKEFNIDQDIHDLLIGSSKFHQMSVNDRKSWFTKISDNDFTYAIRFYNRLKEQMRDIQGAIKLNQSKLVLESDKLLSKEEEEEHLKDIENLSEFIKYLLDLKDSNFVTRESVEKELVNIDNKLTTLTSTINNTLIKFNNEEKFISIEDIDLKVIDTKSNIQTLDNKLLNIRNTLDKEQKTIELLQRSNIDSFDNLDKTIEQHKLEITKLEKMLKFDIIFEDNKASYNALMSVLPNVVDIFNNLEINKDKKYSPINYNLLLEKSKALIKYNQDLDTSLMKLLSSKKELEYHKDHNELECPKCTHKWYKDYSDNKYKEVLKQIELVNEVIDKNSKEIVLTNEEIDRSKHYLELYRAYINITRAWTNLNPLWDHLMSSNAIFESPTKVVTILEDIKVDLDIKLNIDNISTKLKESEEFKLLVSKNQELDINKLNTNIELLNKDLYETNKSIQDSKVYLNKLNFYKECVYNIKEYKTEITNLLTNRVNKLNTLNNVIKKVALNETIQKIQIELSKKERIISHISIQKAIVDNLNNQNTDLNSKLEVLKIMIKELSPTEGLIAKGLVGFINHFIRQMNSFIKQVWSYPLEILPISPNENDDIDLDYKFTVRIDENNVIPDVSKGSSAIKEIIDLAFKVISMNYLNIKDHPLYLDELGASFDKAHRESVAYLINNLILSNNYSQVFIISHYSETYGSFKNTDISVLCENNISLPKNTPFNKNCLIKRN